MEPKHKRRIRYKGTHPKKYNEKYKELNEYLKLKLKRGKENVRKS